MKLTLIRDTFDDNATLGKLLIDGTLFCDTLEDQVRPSGVKVKGATAIPLGTYRLVIDRSTRFKRPMPHVLSVLGFDGVRIHAGNRSTDTEGCILVGRRNGQPDWIGESRATFEALLAKLAIAIAHGEQVKLTIIGAPAAGVALGATTEHEELP